MIDHKMKPIVLALAAVSLSGAVLTSGSPAEARIKCHNGYQIVQGNRLATPFCQDALVAKVAREYGSRVSAKAIRSNPNLKKDVCRLIGQDIRVHHACLPLLEQHRGGGF